jgi:hypothetical protein
LKVLVIVMGLLIVAGFVVIAAEIARRMSTPNAGRPPTGTFNERIRATVGRARGVDDDRRAIGWSFMSRRRAARRRPTSSILATARF